jgi:alpha/beta superfamily hydrolase
MHNNVVDALCNAALQEGLAALRFNFRGVGSSSGSHTSGDGEREDVLAALSTAAEVTGSDKNMPIGLAGYSFGASMAASVLGNSAQRPLAAVLVSPPMSTLAAKLPRIDDDPESGPGAAASLPPLLLITGDSGHVCPAAELEAFAKRIKPAPNCVVIAGADHSWFGHEAELRDATSAFLRWHLTPGPAV